MAPEKVKNRPPKCPQQQLQQQQIFQNSSMWSITRQPSRGIQTADVQVHASATPPTTRRKMFSPKSLRSPFGHRKGNHESNSTLSGKLYFSFSIEFHSNLKNIRNLNTNKGLASLLSSINSDSSFIRKHKGDSTTVTATAAPAAAATGGATAPYTNRKLPGYAGHLSSLVFGKIKSLWSAQTTTTSAGLNQLAGTTEINLPFFYEFEFCCCCCVYLQFCCCFLIFFFDLNLYFKLCFECMRVKI